MSGSISERLAKRAPKRGSAKQVRLKLVYVDFWSVVKLSFLLGIALAIVSVIATFLVWMILNQFGVFDRVNELFQSISETGSDLSAFLSLPQFMSFSFVVAILNLVLTTALGAVGSVLYNLAVKVTGGLNLGFTNK